MRIVVTGADGFIGRNLIVRLGEIGETDIHRVTLDTTAGDLRTMLSSADLVFHLAGVNRPSDPGEFATGNADFTATVCRHLLDSGRPVPIVLSSSIQAELDNPYGRSKRRAEVEVATYGKVSGAATFVFRLPNVFGKWSLPNYNSAVATFCHNVARGLPIVVNDPNHRLSLVYVDDVCSAMIRCLKAPPAADVRAEVAPVYETTVGAVADTVRSFADNQRSLVIPRVGSGLTRALYATYVSYLPPSAFAYPLTRHVDARGAFAEMLKTTDSGQISFFTAVPGVTRGGHYHHTKTEKFLVVRGKARFGFRQIVTNEIAEIFTDDSTLRVVETVPGWAHDITNVGSEDMIVMLWANEIFDPANPDTISAKVGT